MNASAFALYADALTEGSDLVAEDQLGAMRRFAVSEWAADVSAVDARVLERVCGPVLDVGCGPGRHVRALRAAGYDVMGIDASPQVVRFARRQGAAPVLVGDVFAPIPRAGWWRTALLLDGNLGIGGDPIALLARLRTLVAAGGQVVVETDPPGEGLHTGPYRLSDASRTSRWFSWARVCADTLGEVVVPAGWNTDTTWEDHGRWFSILV